MSINKDFKAYATSEAGKRIEKNLLANTSLVTGIHNTHVEEIKPKYLTTQTEKTIEGHSNCYIILGKDRDSGPGSGFGGVGATGAAAIDIVAGLGGPRPVGDNVEAQKDFKNDAARIYLSQMTDLDAYFGLPKVVTDLGKNISSLPLELPEGTSGIAIKADNIRIITKETLKLVTFHRGVNQQSKKATDGGIQILAGCNAISSDPFLTIQPMVKGNNLVMLLRSMVELISGVQGNLNNFMAYQKKINDAMSKHVHQSGAAGLCTSPVIGFGQHVENFKLLTEVLPEYILSLTNIASVDGEYFNSNSPKYINSIWNMVN